MKKSLIFLNCLILCTITAFAQTSPISHQLNTYDWEIMSGNYYSQPSRILLDGDDADGGSILLETGNFGYGSIDGKIDLHAKRNGQIILRTDYGYVDIGPKNSSWAHITTDMPKFYFNKPITAVNSFLSYNSHLTLEAASGYYVQLQPRNSTYGLILREYNSSDYGNIEVTSAGLGIGYNTGGAHMTINPSGKIGIGTTSPTGKLEILSSGSIGSGEYLDWSKAAIRISEDGYLLGMDGNQLIANKELFIQSEDVSQHISFQIARDTKLKISGNGNVGIGTTSPTEKLSVNGNILCEKVRVIADVPQSDYVFKPEYNLMKISDLENFVKSNSHLPEVPSAEEFKEDGYNLGEMDDILLRKIEELTLYIIELNKKIEKLEANQKESE